MNRGEWLYQLYEEGLKDLSDFDRFQNFLEFKSRLYKYSFINSILLWKQIPRATMVADLEVWSQFSRRVARGTKSSFIFDKDTNNTKCVFDISQTYSQKEIFIEQWEWKGNEEIVKRSFIQEDGDEKFSAEQLIRQRAMKECLESIAYLEEQLKPFLISEKEKREIGVAITVVTAYAVQTILSKKLEIIEKWLDREKVEPCLPILTKQKGIWKLVGNNINRITKNIFFDIERSIKENERKENLHRREQWNGVYRGRRWDVSSESRPVRGTTGVQHHRDGMELDKLHEGELSREISGVGIENGTEKESIRDRRTGLGDDTEHRREVLGAKSIQSHGFSRVGGEKTDGEGLRKRSGGEGLPLSLSLEAEQNIISGEDEGKIERIPELDPKGNEIKQEEFLDDVLSESGIGEKTKYQWNIRAVSLLKELEKENRTASFEEKQTLKRFLGWGGLSGVFDESKKAWEKEREELKKVLTEEEYIAARESTPNSHYTPDFVIDEMQNYLSKYQVQTVLEPSAGTGRFLRHTENIKYTAIELDSIPARIMKQLYPNVQVLAMGYEEAEIKDSSFDAVIGNVPFGNYSVFDKKYAKENFLIHDYFIAKSLDAVKENGILILITGKGTMDKENSSVRKYISDRAELLGAIRLPSSTFTKIAGTDVTADILILRKRNHKSEKENSWLGLGYTKENVPINEYFLNHPQHLLGTMQFDSRFFGENSKYTTCVLDESLDIKSMLKSAFESMPAYESITKLITEEEILQEITPTELPLMENFTFETFDKKAYYRRGEIIEKQKMGEKRVEKLEKMVEIRKHILLMMKEQKDNCSDERLKELQRQLKEKYNTFVSAYGEISLKENQKLFEKDRYSAFLFSLEQKDSQGNRKYSDIFSERILKPAKILSHAETVEDAYLASLNEYGKVNFPYMRGLLSGQWTDVEIVKKLDNQIMFNPETSEYEPKEEYLSGEVRRKLHFVERLLEAEIPKEFREILEKNQDALKKVIPIDLVASEIEVKIGTPWIEKEDYEDFLFETLKTPNFFRYGSDRIKIEYNPYSTSYHINNKSANSSNVLSYSVYGTERKNAYEIFEATLNLREIKEYDMIKDIDGNSKRVLNVKETMRIKEKQNLLKQQFKDWIWKDKQRREKYETIYNETFNQLALRQYQGDFLTFQGMNPFVRLQQHQREAVARCLMSGKNTLLAHAVGAGKTYEMIASCMEGKRIGLWQKPLFVVPNHLTQQTGSEFLHLYPSANILVATENDFTPKNRELFFAKMATGNFDAIIIGQTQLIKIGLSKEREIRIIRREIDEISNAILESKKSDANAWTTKGMEVFKKKMVAKLKSLSQAVEKTKLLTFEDLKIDQLFVDEAHDFKSLPVYTKMNNVAGLSRGESQRAMDLFLKIDYLREYYQEKEGKERGAIFATATPIANSMVEMYVMQRFLQKDTLEKGKIRCFDDWASTFGETITALELAPEGTGFRLRTRFGKFVNLPDLLSIFQEIADIKTDKSLNLPKPKAKYHTVEIEPTAFARRKIEEYAERAERIRSGEVDASQDNMLVITHEGRLLGTDPRLLYEKELEEEGEIVKETKLDKVVENIYRIYKETEEEKLTQIVFSDIGTPAKNNEKRFTAYDYVKKELIQKGIPETEICFIHDANDNKQKQELFQQMKTGEKRIIFGSTSKMGTGANMQDKAIALHHMDCPWKSSDIEQREGRIIRPGNQNKEVNIFRYVTKNTFDGYLWQIVEQKQRFISQVMNNRLVSRVAEDVDDRALTFAEVKAIATGNPILIEKVELDLEIAKLETLKASFQKEQKQRELLLEQLPKRIQKAEQYVEKLFEDGKNLLDEKSFSIRLMDEVMEERGKASKKIDEIFLKSMEKDRFRVGLEEKEIGSYLGFSLFLARTDYGEKRLIIKGNGEYSVSSESSLGLLTKLTNKLSKEEFKVMIESALVKKEELLQNQEELMQQKGSFPQEEELKKAKNRAEEIEEILGAGKNETLLDNNRDSENLDELEMEMEI